MTTPAAPIAPAGRRIEVRGGAAVSVTPDTAVVTVAFATRANTADAALADNSRAAASFLAFCASSGVDTAEIRSGPAQTQPRFGQASDGSGPELKYYEATNFLHVRLPDLTKVDAFLREVPGQGGRVHSVEFSLADEEQARSLARAAAFEDATNKARQFAALANMDLGDIVSVTYPSRSEDRMHFDPGAKLELPGFLSADARLLAGVVQVRTGVVLIRAEVDVTWSAK